MTLLAVNKKAAKYIAAQLTKIICCYAISIAFSSSHFCLP